MGLEREMMRFKGEILVRSWRRLREERVAGDSGGDGASPAVMVDKPNSPSLCLKRVPMKKFSGDGYFGNLA